MGEGTQPLLLLVDGSSYLYRAYHALPDLRTSTGEPTGALRGVVQMLRRLARDYPPDYSACVFDAKGKTFRDALYADYKAHRPPAPEDLSRQFEPLCEAIGLMGWPVLSEPGVEADDVIGTLARRAVEAGQRVVVSTGDKDLAQLVNPQVMLINTMTGEVLDEAGVLAKFGVPPERVVDYLALVGDSVDNIPGVPKCGPKTAARWLLEYGSLDNLMAHAGEIKGAVGESLRASLDWLVRARELVTIRRDCDLKFTPGDLKPRPQDTAALLRLFERFELRSLKTELQTELQAGAPAGASAEPASALPGPDRSGYVTVLDEATLDAWLARVRAAELSCLDTETDSLDALRANLVGLSLAVAPGEAAYVPVGHTYAGAPPQLPREWVLARLKSWLEDPAAAKVGQHLKYDKHVLLNYGIELQGIREDTLLESYVLESHKPHDMDSLAERHLGLRTITYAEVAGKGASHIGFGQVDLERATAYAAEDADVTLRLHQALAPQLTADPGLADVYRRIELPLLDVLVAMERAGVLLDCDLLNAQSRELGQKMLALEQQACELAGQPFNLNSPKQIQEILFDKLGLPVRKRTPSGTPSTDEDVLAQLALDYPLPKALLEYRGLAKLKSTYTDKLPKMRNPDTGRVHTNYSQAVAVTGRLASNEPNLQNIPIRTAEGRRIREAFIAPPGARLVSADYSQIELRIMAHISQDAGLLSAFSQGLDVHQATAAEVFGVPLDQVTAEQRRYAKTINFGLIYGMSSFGLANNLGIEKGAAQSFIDRYFARYPGVAEYMRTTRTEAKRQGYVRTVFGRRLYLPEINSPNGPRRTAAERAAINAPMQGTAADLVKLAMIAVHAWLAEESLASRLILQVHDELVLEVPEAELEAVRRELPRLMGGVAELAVPLAVGVGVGPNWEQAH